MYTFIKAIGSKDRKWSAIDGGTTIIKDLYKDFKELLAVLDHHTWIEPKVLDLMALRVELEHSNLTLVQWLELIDERRLDFLGDESVILKKHFVRGVDVWEGGFKIEHTLSGSHPDNTFNENSVPDLKLTKNNVDYIDLYKNFLVTVNGLVHATDANEHGLYVLDGNTTSSIHGDNLASFIDFRALGGFEVLPINEETLIEEANVPINTSARVKSHIDLSEKTVMLVLGGRLMPLDSIVTTTSSKKVKLDLKNVKMDQWFMDTRSRLNYGQFKTPIMQGEVFSPSNLNSEAFFKEFLLYKHSFLIAINTKNVYIQEKQLEHAQLPGRYNTVKPIRGYLQFDNGTIGEYINFGNERDSVVATRDEFSYNYDYETKFQANATEHVTDSFDRLKPKTICRAKEILLFTYKTA